MHSNAVLVPRKTEKQRSSYCDTDTTVVFLFYCCCNRVRVTNIFHLLLNNNNWYNTTLLLLLQCIRALVYTLIGDSAPMTRRAETFRPDLAQCSNFSTSIRLSFLRQEYKQKQQIKINRFLSSVPAYKQNQSKQNKRINKKKEPKKKKKT